MDVQEEFYKLLDSIKIDSSMNPITANEKYSILSNWLVDHTPHQLYRFRSEDQRNIDYLRDDEVWGSRPNTFNDPFECMPCYDMEKCFTNIKQALDLNSIKQTIHTFKEKDALDYIKHVLPIEIAEKFIAYIQNISFDDDMNEKIKSAKNEFMNFLWQNFAGMSNQFYRSLALTGYQEYLACFSERNDATLMWGHYANGHKGFCVEYNWYEHIKELCEKNEMKSINWMLAPVHYSASRYNATSYMQTVMQDFLFKILGINVPPYYTDTLVGLKSLLTKSEDWKYENEWRLFSSTPTINPSEDYRKLTTLKASAVYIGAKAEKIIADEIEKVCSNKNIPCYKMILGYSDTKFSVSSILYSEYKAIL